MSKGCIIFEICSVQWDQSRQCVPRSRMLHPKVLPHLIHIQCETVRISNMAPTLSQRHYLRVSTKLVFALWQEKLPSNEENDVMEHNMHKTNFVDNWKSVYPSTICQHILNAFSFIIEIQHFFLEPMLGVTYIAEGSQLSRSPRRNYWWL